MRYRLRTLLIVLGVAPPALALLWFAGPPAWFLLALGVFTLPALYCWVADDKPTGVGLVVRRVAVLVIVLVAILGFVALLMPAVQ